MSDEGKCVYCLGAEGPINPDRDYRKVTGWERHRTQGGTNAVRLREVQKEWAHAKCIDRRQRGIADGQQALL